MSSRGSQIQKALEEFRDGLKSALPLEHFTQFYQDSHFDKLAKQKSKEILVKVQANSELEVEETVAVVNELLPKFQQVIREWKAKNEENKVQCDHLLQNQVEFLLSDFRTSVVIKLVSAPDVGLEDLEAYLEGRKLVLIGIFNKLSKPGDPRSNVDMKRGLIDRLECVKVETLEKQRLHLEQEATDKNKKMLENAKGIIMEYARRLKSDLENYQGKYPKDLVKGKLEEINSFLCFNGNELKAYHPNICSAVLRTTAEVRKCLDEENYEDMSAQEFAETLHEQLLYDFSGESQVGRNSSGMDLDSINSNDGSTWSNASKQNDYRTNENEAQHCQLNELQNNFVREEGIKEEIDEDEIDQDTNGKRVRSSNIEVGLMQFGDDGGNSEDDEGNEMAEINKSPVENSEIGRGNLSNSKTHVSNSTRTSHSGNSSRRSAKLRNSTESVAETKRSRPIRRCVVVQAKKSVDDDKCSGRSSDDSCGKEDIQVGSGKSNVSKTHQVGKRRRRLNVADNGKPKTDKITYLHLDKRGRPIYRCNVCCRNCRQSMLRYHGSYCGKSDNPFTCKVCGKTFMFRAHLVTHARTHTGEKPFKCSKCSKRFSVKCNFKKHVCSHGREARYMCEPCQLTFSSNLCLHQHKISKHKEEFPFGCVYCKERFDGLCKLKNHVITHTDMRPFWCPTCDYSAITKYNLASHIRGIHSQSRQAAQKLANEAAITYLVKDTKDDSYRNISHDKINSLVISHIIKKANLTLPEMVTEKAVSRLSSS